MTPQPPSQNSLPLPPPEDDDEINLLELLDVVLDSRWLIACITILALLTGLAYALISTPGYEANTLIQVEDSKTSANGILGDVGSLFDIKSSATAEIEILRSRFVVGQAAKNLKLDLVIEPKYIPLIGKALASRATEPSDPGFLGMKGYVSGSESLEVAYFQVAKSLEDKRYVIRVNGKGYSLVSPDGDELGNGTFGVAFSFKDGGESGEILVVSAVGKPGAEFYVASQSLLEVTEQLQKDLNIAEQGKQSGVIKTSLQGPHPELIAQILNEIGKLYVRQNTERKAAEAEKAINFLDTQLPQLRKQLESAEGKFNDFRNRNATFDLSAEAKVLLDQVVALKVSLLTLQQKRTELLTRFTPQHPAIQAVDVQIKDITGQINNIETRTRGFPNIEQDLLRLTRDVKVSSDLYTGLLNSFQQLRLVKEGKVGNVRVVDVAVVPEKPVKPRRALVVALAIALGLILGMVAAFVRHSLRPGLKDPSDIEQRSGLSVFATVPHSEAQVLQARRIKERETGMHVLAITNPQDPVVESLRSLRTALQFALIDATSNIVMFTGATPSIGKSFTSVNFATVAAAGDKRVLLVDADLRKGHLSSYFGLKRLTGLSDVISGSVKFEAAVHKNVAPNLDFLSTGTLPPNPAELLISAVNQQIFSTIALGYDLLIMDTAPVLAASDASIVAPTAGTLFLIARAEVTSLGELQETTKRLRLSGAEVSGVIFNDLDMSKRRYRYGYGYGYKYGRYRYTTYNY